MQVDAVFNETTLREHIANMWGQHGAHVDVYDAILREVERLQSYIDIRNEADEEMCEGFGATIRELQAENERLRTALVECRAIACAPNGYMPDVWTVAEQALSGGDDR